MKYMKLTRWPYAMKPVLPGEEGCYCKCGRQLMWMAKDRDPYEIVKVKCPVCGFEITYGGRYG